MQKQFKNYIRSFLQWVMAYVEEPKVIQRPHMKTCLVTFVDDKARDKFFSILKNISDKMTSPENLVTDPSTAADGNLLKEALRTIKLDPPLKADHERTMALFVSGRKMREGTAAELGRQFLQEVDAHKAAVELKELKDGEWVTVRSRKLQRQM